MNRVIVRDGRGEIASDEVFVRDPDDDQDVIAAGKAICKANGRTFPSPATLVVQESIGRNRWQQVRRFVA